MALAYCILAHKNPAQVARLLRAVWHPANLYLLHYEKRAPRDEHRALSRLAEEHPNVRILPPRVVLWGRYSQVAIQLKAISCLLHTDAPWTHFINLTGQDFPLKPQAAIMRELAAAGSTSFVSYFDPFDGTHWQNPTERLTRVHIDSALLEAVLRTPGFGRWARHYLGWSNQMPFVPLIRRQPPSSLKYIGGSNHVVLSREAASYICSDPKASETIRWLKWTGHPDESVYQCTLLNSRFSELTVNDDRRAVFWAKAGDLSPRTLALTDLQRLREARDAGNLFARKFDLTVDEKVICEIEKEVCLPIAAPL